MESNNPNYDIETFEKTVKYQEDFLEFFGLDNYDDEAIRNQVETYFNLMKDIECIYNTARHLAENHFLSNDIELGFFIFFSEDYFYNFKALIDYYDENDEFNMEQVEAFCSNIKK